MARCTVQKWANVATNFSSDRTQSGWVVGSGVEAALGGNWTGKIEYLYLNLGNKTDISTLFAATPINTEIRENIFRVGLNYRIGGKAYAPVVAANWSGFYLGGNFGSGTGRDRSSLSLPAAGIVETFDQLRPIEVHSAGNAARARRFLVCLLAGVLVDRSRIEQDQICMRSE